jgi:TonB family protein
MKFCLGFSTIVFLSMVSSSSLAQTPAERLASAAKVNGLAGIDQKPYHLKADVTLFDDAGKNPQLGTIEAWHSGADLRIVYSFGASTATEIRKGTAIFRAASGPDLSYRANEVFNLIFHPGPTDREIQSSKVQVENHLFGEVKLECIELTQPTKTFGVIPIGLYPSYCLQPGAEPIRAIYDFGSASSLVNGMAKFLEHVVPTNFSILDKEKIVATAKVTFLAMYVPTPGQYEPTPDMAQVRYTGVSGAVMAHNIITQPVRVYPDFERRKNIEGTVILGVTIGRDGHVNSVRLISSPNAAFAVSAIDEVRRYIYKPYILNGGPNEVETTVAVPFQMMFHGVEDGGIHR